MKRSLSAKKSLAQWIVMASAALSLVQGLPAQQTPENAAVSPAPTPEQTAARSAFVNQYCVGCHNQRNPAAGLALDAMDLAGVGRSSAAWEGVVRKLRAGMMPPAGMLRPGRAEVQDFAGWLEAELDRAAALRPNPGRPALHRLNRTEYQNAVRDLLALEVDAASLLPADDSSHGFDNIAGSLAVSPALLERYLSAAINVSRLAMGNPAVPPSQYVYRAPGDLSQTGHVEGLPFGTRGGLLVRHHFPLDGEYSIRVNLLLAPAQTRVGAATGGEQLEVILNGERVALFDVDEQEDLEGMEVRVHVPAGMQTIGAAFIGRNFKSDDAIRPFLRSTFDPTICIQAGWTCLPHVGTITITGPLGVAGPGDTPSRRAILTCRPSGAANPAEEETCAKQILSRLAGRAFRRPAREEDLEVLMSFYEAGRRTGTFDDGIEAAIQRILASPEFVFRFPDDPPEVPPGGTFRISDLELASRLSFFLWSTIPDDELIGLASQGRLRDAGVLAAEVRRMLEDPRSQAFVENFAGQWLYLRNLAIASPVPLDFPDFDDNLRQAFRREAELFFESILREDRSVIELLTADYTYVNERLARHYGIPNVSGSHFRRVTLGGDFDARRGLLGKGAILTVTSYPNRTSPVLRGQWVLKQLLGTPPPAPPADVPELKEDDRGDVARGHALSVRERLEQHRANPACSGCHNIMDPIGLALENFDAVGMWRTRDEAGAPIDASARLVDGTAVDGAAALRRALLEYSDQVVRTLTENLMTYALGRGLEHYDMPAVRSIVREASRNDYRFSALVLGIVESMPFQMRIKEN